ncbi:hypothetical protein PVAP13_4KG139415 [Panicum virgatum]|uniref:Secreted protein n=1 Tax=Panicum virgatum TaxID=38727 RepID=A0A8T0TV52_PANVG|nr:hypothetical protein PVAP13_4KG139415 [Panicum virgatum]
MPSACLVALASITASLSLLRSTACERTTARCAHCLLGPHAAARMGTRPGSRSTRTPWRMATLGARNAAEQDLEFGSCPIQAALDFVHDSSTAGSL